MNILHISQILPIPGYYKTNDFVFKLSTTLLQQNPQHVMHFIRPVPYTNSIIKRLFQQSSISLPKDFKEYHFSGHKIWVIRFLSMWHFTSLHALSSFSAYLFHKKLIQNIVRMNQIQVIHAQFIFPDGIIALMLKKKFNIPYILTTHTELRYFQSVISKRIAHSVLNNAFRITPLNYRNQKLYTELGYKTVEILPLGIDNKFLLKQRVRDSNSEFRMITLCDLIPLKNIDKVLRAISMLKQKYALHFTIFGQGAEEENLKKLVIDLDINDFVTFGGYVAHEKLPEILAGYDLFVMPSFPETFGRVYFEAMAVGLPVICAKNSGIFGYFPELVDKYAVHHENVQEIAERTEWFILNTAARQSIGKSLSELMSEYTWDKIANRINHLYYSAVIESQKGLIPFP